MKDELKRLADKAGRETWRSAASWRPSGRPPAADRRWATPRNARSSSTQVEKACRIAEKLREMGVRPNGVVRIDSACSVEQWADDPDANQKRIAETFREACRIAEDHGERLAAEGEICWGGMHSWRRMVQLLEMVDRPETLGFQADMAHTLLYLLGYNAPEDALLPPDFDWNDEERFDAAYAELTEALRPWTIDFHVAQNDATVHGSGSHDKTGRHCLATDPNGKLDIPRARRLLAPRRRRRTDQADSPPLLGRLHVPQRRDDQAAKPGTTSSGQ